MADKVRIVWNVRSPEPLPANLTFDLPWIVHPRAAVMHARVILAERAQERAPSLVTGNADLRAKVFGGPWSGLLSDGKMREPERTVQRGDYLALRNALLAVFPGGDVLPNAEIPINGRMSLTPRTYHFGWYESDYDPAEPIKSFRRRVRIEGAFHLFCDKVAQMPVPPEVGLSGHEVAMMLRNMHGELVGRALGSERAPPKVSEPAVKWRKAALIPTAHGYVAREIE